MLKRILPYALGQFFIVAFQWMTMLFLPLFLKARGLGEAGIGLQVSLFWLSTLVLVFPLGVLSDRLPSRALLLAAAALAAGSFSLMPMAGSAAGFGALTFLAGTGSTLGSIALYSLFFKQVGDDRRGSEVSWFYIGGIMGAGVGAWIGGLLISALADVNAVFVLSGLFALAWAGIALVLPSVRGLSFPILDYGQELKQPRTWALIAVMFVAASHAGFEQSSYTLLQTEVLGLSAATIGRIFLILAVWMSLISALAGKMHDERERPVLMMGLGLILSGVFMAVSGSARGAIDFTVWRILHTTGDSGLNLVILVVASRIFPRARAGGAFAFALTVNTASYFLFANLGGLVGQAFGLDRAFHLSGAIEVAGGVTLLALRPRVRRLFREEKIGVRAKQ